MVNDNLKEPGENLAKILKANIKKLEDEIAGLQAQRDGQVRVLRSLEAIVPTAGSTLGSIDLSLEDAIDEVMPPAGTAGATVREIYDGVSSLAHPVTTNKVTIFNVKNIIQRKHAERGWTPVSRGVKPTRWRQQR